APDFTCGSWTGYWLIQYRGVGSGNGLDEFVDWNLIGRLPQLTPSGFGLINRTPWANVNGVPQHPCADCNTTTTPVCPQTIDIAVMDVPTKWFVRAGSTGNAHWNKKPTQDGYGQNSRTSTTGFTNKLQSLSRGALTLNTNTGTPDTCTVFDTPVAFVPIAICVNRGTGLQNVDDTALQHLYVTGRMPNGENLVGATRDAGSGTRNGTMGSLGIDSSWGAGDNIGDITLGTGPTANSFNLGSNHQPTNLGSTGNM